MRSLKIYIIIFLLFIIAVLFSWQYIFSIYEVIYNVEPKKLFADNSSTLIIEIVPLNSFGWKAPLRNSTAVFTITEGRDLIDIIFIDNAKGKIKIRAKNKSGKVSVTIKPEFSLLPSTIEIIIEPNVV